MPGTTPNVEVDTAVNEIDLVSALPKQGSVVGRRIKQVIREVGIWGECQSALSLRQLGGTCLLDPGLRLVSGGCQWALWTCEMKGSFYLSHLTIQKQLTLDLYVIFNRFIYILQQKCIVFTLY